MRDNYFSFMKGLAIIGVLFIHTPFMIGDGTAGIACRQLVTFAVAMFFFLSGYFVKDDRLNLKGISRIGIPYIYGVYCGLLKQPSPVLSLSRHGRLSTPFSLVVPFSPCISWLFFWNSS